MFFLLFSLFFHSHHAAALTIVASDVDKIMGPELLKECREMGHGEACASVIGRRDVVEREALESCLTFKSEEDSAPMDDDRPQYEKGPGFSRYRHCLNAVKGKSFNGKALSVCSVMNDFLQQLECLHAVADKAFHLPTAEACLKISYSSTNAGLDCLKLVAGRALSKAKILSCEKTPAKERLACLRSDDQQDLLACERKLNKVEWQLQELSANSSSRALKQSIRPILDALEHKGSGVSVHPVE